MSPAPFSISHANASNDSRHYHMVAGVRIKLCIIVYSVAGAVAIIKLFYAQMNALEDEWDASQFTAVYLKKCSMLLSCKQTGEHTILLPQAV